MELLCIGILSLVCCVGPAGAQIEFTKGAGFLRTTIETYPEAERRPILDYLDAARAIGDRAAEAMATGRGEALFHEIEAMARANGRELDARAAAARIESIYGIVTSYEYRAQALEAYGDDPDVHDLARATSVVYYAVRTTKRPDGDLFLAIKTVHVGGEHRVFRVTFNDHLGRVPPWLQPKPSPSSRADGAGEGPGAWLLPAAIER